MDNVTLSSATLTAAPRLEPAVGVASKSVGSAPQPLNEMPRAAEASPKESAYSAVDKFKTLVQELQRNLDFSVDEASGQVVVKVVDGESGKLVRQIPSEELLRLSERLEDMRSLLFKAEA